MTVTSDQSAATAVLPPGLEPGPVAVEFVGEGETRDIFAVTDIAGHSIAAATCALAALAGRPRVTVDRRLASFWFQRSLRPLGWQSPRIWDALSGDYRAADGWIRLHCNAPGHRAVVERVLDRPADRDAVSERVSKWKADDLQQAVVEAGGAAATMYSADDWRRHPQGRAVNVEPLVAWRDAGEAPLERDWPATRPLAGLRVLDLTRILAGPTATRFLAAFGARVLRIDPPDWDETGNIAEMTPGKRCATLELKTAGGRETLTGLLREADILVHGYRADALDGLGLGDARRRALNPGLIDVALNAYGWSGPWRNRRGYDSLVQMSSGIAEAGMRAAGADRPRPLTVQALDYATGYLMAAAVLNALRLRRESGRVTSARLSLARTAEWLKSTLPADSTPRFGAGLAAETDEDLDNSIEHTAWGDARRLRWPWKIDGIEASWDSPATPLHTSEPTFSR